MYAYNSNQSAKVPKLAVFSRLRLWLG